MQNISLTNKKVGYFNNYVLRRIRQNKNFICCITGGTGSGKSFSALREGEILDPDFDIDNVCFTARQFMNLVNGDTKKLHKGSVIIFDEIQVSLSHLEFKSIQARMLNYVLQTFRHKNFILFITSPNFKFINASARKLIHSRWETVSINEKDKTCLLKPFLIQINQKTEKIYEKYLRVSAESGGLTPMKSIKCKIPSKELLDAYEEKKIAFTHELNKGIQSDLDKIENGGQGKKKLEFTYDEKDVKRLLDEKKLPNEIATIKDRSERMIRHWMKRLADKGVEIVPIKDGLKVKHYETSDFP